MRESKAYASLADSLLCIRPIRVRVPIFLPLSQSLSLIAKHRRPGSMRPSISSLPLYFKRITPCITQCAPSVQLRVHAKKGEKSPKNFLQLLWNFSKAHGQPGRGIFQSKYSTASHNSVYIHLEGSKMIQIRRSVPVTAGPFCISCAIKRARSPVRQKFCHFNFSASRVPRLRSRNHLCLQWIIRLCCSFVGRRLSVSHLCAPVKALISHWQTGALLCPKTTQSPHIFSSADDNFMIFCGFWDPFSLFCHIWAYIRLILYTIVLCLALRCDSCYVTRAVSDRPGVFSSPFSWNSPS